MKTGLCVIFNHPFSAQLPLLRELYGWRFAKILFLHPLDAAAAAPDVCVVFGGGFTFDVMITAARERILQEFHDCENVLFVHNDVLLNPAIKSDTFAAEFQMAPGSILTCGIGDLSHSLNSWTWGFRAIANFTNQRFLFAGGAESAMAFLPSAQIAQEKARAAGLDDTTLLYPASEEVLGKLPPVFRMVHNSVFGNRDETERGNPINIYYPLFIGYSDFFAISVELLPEWLGYLGPLSSMLLFSEVAIPTASVLTARRLMSLRDLNRGMQTLWGAQRGTAENFDWVLERFAAGDAFIHPVKWNLLSGPLLDRLRHLLAPPKPGG